jgi:trk system potassium uptake protein
MRLVAVANVLSRVLVLFAASMALPWAISLLVEDGAHLAFAYALGATLLAGLALWLATLHERRELQVRDGFLLVGLVWTVLPAFATLPLLLSIEGLSFTDAYFEAVSGLTASGATGRGFVCGRYGWYRKPEASR